MNFPSPEKPASVYLAQEQYAKAIELYEQAIADAPNVMSNYWHLGLVLLLQGQEAEAQMVWLSAMSQGTSEQVELWTAELIEVLDTEAQRREVSGDYSTAWLISQHIREAAPEYLDNLLRLIPVSIRLGLFVPNEDAALLQVTQLVTRKPVIELDSGLLLQVLQDVWSFDASNSCIAKFAEACITYYQMVLQESPDGVGVLLNLGKVNAIQGKLEAAIACYKKVLEIKPDSTETYFNLGRIYYHQGKNAEGFNLTKQALHLPPDNLDLEQIQNPDFWQSLNPDLSVCQDLALKPGTELIIDESHLQELLLNLKEEGYFQLDGLIPAQEVEKLAVGIERLQQHHLRPAFILVYDEAWQLFRRFSPLLSAILGSDYREITFWAWYIDPKKAETGWKPHIDRVSKLRPDGLTDSVNIWIALTNATPLNGCMYIVPANLDPSYGRAVNQPEFPLQSIRALPVPAGSILCWNSQVWHWGGKSSTKATQPRISIAKEFQRGDVAPYVHPVLDPLVSLSLPERLGLVGLHILKYRNY